MGGPQKEMGRRGPETPAFTATNGLLRQITLEPGPGLL